MATKTKTFDCVEMKRRAQEQIRAEFEARKAEFRSFGDFIRVKAEESEPAKAIREKIARTKKGNP